MCLPNMGKTDSALLDTTDYPLTNHQEKNHDPTDHKEIKGIR